jgi:hypothetical protein
MGVAMPAVAELGQQRAHIIEAIGTAATKCDNRGIISDSGILPALARWMHAAPASLTAAHVEFLQCSVLAAQYHYARRMVDMEWPRPIQGSELVQTLRYFYLRGLVHMGCEEWQWAVRSFWTCLSVPFEGISAIVIAAWKKMVLCQCLLGGSTGLPPATSNAMSRFLTTREGESQNIPAYRDLVKAFQGSDQVQFTALQQTHGEVWQTDGTTGLVDRLATEVLHRRVRHLASVYSVISLDQLSNELQVPVGNLPLLLEQVNGLTVRTDGDFLSLDLVEANPISQEGLIQLMDLTERIRAIDLSIASSARYQHLKDSSNRTATSGPLGVAEL